MNGDKKLCYICFKNDTQELFDLSTLDTDNVSYLDKLKEFINKDLIHSSNMLLCTNCAKCLSISYTFKNEVLNSQEIWAKKYLNKEVKSVLLVNAENDFLKQQELNGDNFANEIIQSKNKVNHEFEDSCNDLLLDDKTDEYWNDLCSFSCKKCSENFNSSDELITHNCNVNQETPKKIRKILVKGKKSNLILTCPICEVTFNKKYKLRKHRRKFHMPTEEKRFVCTYCDKSFKQSYHLREHITSHTGERNYSCPICDKKFQRISSQKRHMRTHEAPPGQKSKKTPFLCTICGKSFPYSNGVQRHMRIHTGIKNHECDICNRKFSQSTHLHVHLRTHTGEKPYICDTCGEAFSLNASLQKHMSVHEKETKDSVRDEIQLLNDTASHLM